MTLGAEPERLARAFRDRVLACGAEPVNRLEHAVEGKLADTRALESLSPSEFPIGFARILDGLVATRRHRPSLLRESPAEVVTEILREGRQGHLGAAELPRVAERLSGAPLDVRIDHASELLHATGPDRVPLIARWVWNPARHTGILAEFGGPLPDTYAATQVRLAEVRLELDALGFPSPTFAAVDVLLALTYAGRLAEAVDRSFQGGGIERLLPGAYPLAAILLGVRRRPELADR